MGQMTSGQAAALASPAATSVLPYAQWKAATIASYPGENAAEQAADTTQAAYQQYLGIHNVTQQERAQGGSAAFNSILASMAGTPDLNVKAAAPSVASSAILAGGAAVSPTSATASGQASDVEVNGTTPSPAPAVATAATAATTSTGLSTTAWIAIGVGAAVLAYFVFGSKK